MNKTLNKIKTFFKKSLWLRLAFQKKMSLVFAGTTLFSITAISISLLFYFTYVTKNSTVTSLALAAENNTSIANHFFSRINLSLQMLRSDTTYFPAIVTDENIEPLHMMQNYNQMKSILKSNTDLLTSEVMSYGKMVYFADESIPMYSMLQNTKNLGGIFKSSFPSTVYIYQNESVKNEEWYKKAIEREGEIYWFVSPLEENTLCGAKSLVYSRTVGNSISHRNLGVAFINFDVSWILNKLNTTRLTEKSVIVLTDSAGEVVYATDRLADGTNMKQLQHTAQANLNEMMIQADISGRKFYCRSIPLGNELNLTSLIPVKDVENIANNAMWIVFLVAAVIMVTGTALVVYFSQIISRPINTLSSHMRNNSSLEYISGETSSSEEILVMYESYNTLMSRISSLINQVYEAAEKEKQAKFNMLQTQINPHFLYNSLDSISCVALVRGEKDISRALSRLADVMRYNLKNPDAFVSIGDELGQIENYMYLQILKYGELVEYYPEVADESKKYMILKMIIQPLVENCVNHGLSNLKDPTLKIRIRTEASGGVLRILVMDNGVCENVQAINDHINGKVDISQDTGGIGARNINERIKVKFGEGFGLTYEQSETGGTTAVIVVPMIEASQEPPH